MAIFSLCLHWCSLCTYLGPIFSSDKDSSHIGLVPTLMNLFYLNHLCKDPITIYSYILSCWGLGLRGRAYLNQLLLASRFSRNNLYERLHIPQDTGGSAKSPSLLAAPLELSDSACVYGPEIWSLIKNRLLLAEAVMIYYYLEYKSCLLQKDWRWYITLNILKNERRMIILVWNFKNKLMLSVTWKELKFIFWCLIIFWIVFGNKGKKRNMLRYVIPIDC